MSIHQSFKGLSVRGVLPECSVAGRERVLVDVNVIVVLGPVTVEYIVIVSPLCGCQEPSYQRDTTHNGSRCGVSPVGKGTPGVWGESIILSEEGFP
jgi:hypothetical protein